MFDTIQNDRPIESVIPADYNYDGLLDLLLVSKDDGGMELKYYFGQHHSSGPEPSSFERYWMLLNSPDIEYTIDSKSVPFLVETNGDRL